MTKNNYQNWRSEMKKDRYILTLNKNQLYVLQSALEVLSRMYSGQWEMAFDECFRFRKEYYKKMDADLSVELKNDIEHKYGYHKGTFYQVLDFFKGRILGLVPNEGYGVGSKDASWDMTTAFDIKQVVRTMLGDKREPSQFDTKNPLPTINIKPRKKTNTLRLTRQRYKK